MNRVLEQLSRSSFHDYDMELIFMGACGGVESVWRQSYVLVVGSCEHSNEPRQGISFVTDC